VADYAPEVRKLLRTAGWRFGRPGKGDHEVWMNEATSRHVIVDSKFLWVTAASQAGACRRLCKKVPADF
jgi:hypothetical protein